MKAALLLFLIFSLSSEPFTEGRLRNWEKEDKIALSITPTEARSVMSLVDKIKSVKTDEWGKFRIAFRWVTEHIAYDYASYKSGNIKSVTPNETIKLKKAVCQGYAELLKAIADGLGIRCEVIVGYSKGAGYKEGDKFADTNHAWNAAQFAGQWYLFDATWAAGYVDTKKGRYYKKFETFYFAPAPEQLVFNHLPADVKWQLLSNPITLSEFEKRGEIQVSLFRLGLSVESLLTLCSSFQHCDLVGVNPIYTTIEIEKVTIPFEGTLSDGKTYTFSITSPKGNEFFIMADKKSRDNKLNESNVMIWDRNIIPMEYRKGVHRATLAVKSGDVTLYVRTKGKGKEDTLFFWKVK